MASCWHHFPEPWKSILLCSVDSINIYVYVWLCMIEHALCCILDFQLVLNLTSKLLVCALILAGSFCYGVLQTVPLQCRAVLCSFTALSQLICIEISSFQTLWLALISSGVATNAIYHCLWWKADELTPTNLSLYSFLISVLEFLEEGLRFTGSGSFCLILV